MTITALYLVKNEEEFLPLSVATVIDSVDKVVIIDNESTDGSLVIAESIRDRHPDKIELHKMEGDFDHNCEFNNRNKSLQYVKTDWVLALDADQLLSDGWHNWIKHKLDDRRFDAIRFRYEHYVGSYEHIHKTFYEKQKNNSLYPEVPLWQTVLWRMRPDFEFKPAALSDPRFMEFHHASPDLSMTGRSFYNCGSATVFHYGFSKKNMMDMSVYRIHRGDYGHDDETKARLTKELVESNNPFKFIGSVHRVDYKKNMVPSVMRSKFGKTYKLELDTKGFIQSRIHIPTGRSM